MHPIYITIYFFIVAFNFILGTIILIRNRASKTHQSFYAFILAVVVWIITLFFLYYNPSNVPYLTLLGRTNFVAGGLAIYFLFLLARNFPTPSTLPPLIRYSTFAATVALSLVTLFTPLIDQQESLVDGTLVTSYGTLYPWFVIHFIGFMLTSLFILFRKYRKSSGFAKQQLKLLFVGLTLTTGFTVITNLFIPLLFGYYDLQFFGPLSTIFMIGTVSYAIVRHRFLDIRLVIARSVAYTLLVSTLGIIYTGGLFFVSSIINEQTASTSNLLTSTGLALVIAFSFQPLLRFFEKITNKIFYKDQYDEDKLLKTLAHTMASTLTLSTLVYKILDILTTQMKISKAYFAIIQNDKLYILESNHQKGNAQLTNEEFKIIPKNSEILVFEELQEGALKDLFRKKEFSVVLPIKTKEHFIGFLVLKDKSSGDIYFGNDINILEIIGPELAVALQNAQRFEEIKQFNVTLQEEVRKATADLKEANSHLKDLDKMKDEFISVASHELRTPITAIKGFIWIALNKHKLPKKLKDSLEQAYSSTERSIYLVNDMLDVSRIESGRIDLNPKQVDLVKLAAKVQGQLGSKITEKNLVFKIEKSEPQLALFDHDKILQVFINLVGNAIKFTPAKGTITISFKDTGESIETSVTDTGIGIKKKDIAKLFQKFGRLDNSFSSISETPGTGLGLFISKQIIDLSGGKISVTSQLKKGTTFTFTLPKSASKPKKKIVSNETDTVKAEK